MAEIQVKRARRDCTDDSLTLIPLAEAYLQQHKYVEFFAEIVTRGVDRELDAEGLILCGRAHLERREVKRLKPYTNKPASCAPNMRLSFLIRLKFFCCTEILNKPSSL